MRSTRRLPVAGLLALCAASVAAGQKVYRCGPDGRVYQQTPCAEGRPVDASDPRSEDQRQAAQALAKDEAKAAAQYDKSLQPASAPKTGRTKPAAEPPAGNGKPADATKKKADAESKPTVYLVPKPRAAASAPDGSK